MKKTALIFSSLLLSFFCYSQSSNSILIGGGFDFIKTDNTGLLEKMQLGLEGHYFVVRHFAVGAGTEIWTDKRSSFMMGMRYYLMDNVFVRFRGLIGANDASLGAGWAKPLNDKLRFEAMGDFYFADPQFGVRAGVSYVLK